MKPLDIIMAAVAAASIAATGVVAAPLAIDLDLATLQVAAPPPAPVSRTDAARSGLTP